MAHTTDSLYPRLPANVSPLFHFVAIPLFTVLVAFSGVAIIAILTLSFALQLGRWLLGCVPGLAYLGNAWVSGYHRQVQRLADRWLKDPRDEPILAAALTLALTAGPVFILQLWLGAVAWPLVLAFYAAVYGPNIRGFVRSFSSMHQEGHVPGGVFKRPSRLDKWCGNSLLYMFFAIPMGLTPHALAHLQQHHRENAGPLDIYATARYDHANLWHFVVYMVREVMYQQFLISPYLYFRSREKRAQMRAMVTGNLLHLALFTALAWYSLPIAVFYMLVPWCASNVLMGVIHWSQHAFYGGQADPRAYMYNTVTLLEKPVNILNEGYHVCHHHWANVHWSESPQLFERIKPEMRAAQSMVFRDLSVMDLFLLLMLRRFEVLADKLEWWEPLSREEKVALLRQRVRPAPIQEHERMHQQALARRQVTLEPGFAPVQGAQS